MFNLQTPCVSLSSSFCLRSQLQCLPRLVLAPPCSSLTVVKAAPDHHLLDWSFEEADKLPDKKHKEGDKQQGKQPGSTSHEQQRRYQRQCDEAQKADRQQQCDQRYGGPHQRGVAVNLNGSKRRKSGVPRHLSAQQQQHRQQHVPPKAAQHTSKHLRQRSVQPSLVTEADEYAAVQQRIRQLLISADINNPLAAADSIPDTVNDIVTALQVIATAAKPSKLQAIKQYQSARHQLTAAVVNKFKQLLLNSAVQTAADTDVSATGPQQPLQQQQQQPMTTVDCLSAAASSLPPTKLAAATFALGVLRYYDTDLVPALAAAAAHIITRSNKQHCSALRSRTRTAQAMKSQPGVATANLKLPAAAATIDSRMRPQQQQQQQSLHQSVTVQLPVRFNANQLGQLAQGFVYLDHSLSPDWQEEYLTACRQQFRYMRGQQLASLAEFIIHYRNYSSSSTSSTVAPASSCKGVNAQLDTAAESGTPSSASVLLDLQETQGSDLNVDWVQEYLAAAAAQADSMNPTQLVSVLRAAAGLYREWQQQQPSDRLDAFVQLPLQMPTASAVARSQNKHLQRVSGSEASDWLLPLLRAFQQQLPDLKINHLAAVLPALAAVTVTPWDESALTPLLLQVRLLLPAAAGPDTVSVAAAVVRLGAASQVRSDTSWCDAYLHRSHALMHTLGPADLATAVSTLAQLRYRPYNAWLYELCSRLRIEVKNMSRDELANTLEGLSVLKVKLDPELLHLFVLGIKRWLGLMQCGDMRRVTKALSDMYRRPGGRSVLPGRTVQQLVEEMERRIGMEALQQGGPF